MRPPSQSTAPSHLPSSELIVAFAACADPAWQPTLAALPAAHTPHCRALLKRMQIIHTDPGPADSLSPPHERALARALGWPALADGLLPWAARAAAAQRGSGFTPITPNSAWATITPCHWAMGREYATLTDPEVLHLQVEESLTLLGSMQPYFASEGITLHAPNTGGQGSIHWLAEGEVFRHLPTAALDRVLGRNVDPWLPQVGTATPAHPAAKAAAQQLRRLQNEMQMLLYTHPLNDVRSAQGLWPVNSVWISGTGALPLVPPSQAQAATADVQLLRDLAPGVFKGDWPAYANAWAALDAGPLAALLQCQQAGQTVRLTLCGERQAHTYESHRPSWRAKIKHLLAPSPC